MGVTHSDPAGLVTKKWPNQSISRSAAVFARYAPAWPMRGVGLVRAKMKRSRSSSMLRKACRGITWIFLVLGSYLYESRFQRSLISAKENFAKAGLISVPGLGWNNLEKQAQ